MRSQLRLQVLLPVAILGVLGLGVGAFATTRSGPATSDADAIAARIAAKQQAKEPEKPEKPKKQKTNPSTGTQSGPKTTPVQDALQKHAIVVVLFYAPGDDYDTIQTRETRAGALSAHAGFLALDVTQNARVSAIATQYEVREAPATLVFKRGPKLVYRAEGYMDRQAIAQAVANAR
jgi:hypothetical protein